MIIFYILMLNLYYDKDTNYYQPLLINDYIVVHGGSYLKTGYSSDEAMDKDGLFEWLLLVLGNCEHIWSSTIICHVSTNH